MIRTSVFGFLRQCCIGMVALAVLAHAGNLHGQEVNVRVREGFAHGFLVLRSLGGDALAGGEFTQTPHGDRVTSRLVFRFKDGSIDEETAVYSQGRSFHLISDHHIQKGPSFPHPYDAFIDTTSQQVSVQEDESKPAKTEPLELPPDLSNGLVLAKVRNLHPDRPEIEIPYLAVASKSRVVKLAIASEGQGRFKVGGVSYKTNRYVIKVKIGGVPGVVAPVIGKKPSDSHVWITAGPVPVVVRVDAPLYTDGPIWSIQLASPVW